MDPALARHIGEGLRPRRTAADPGLQATAPQGPLHSEVRVSSRRQDVLNNVVHVSPGR